jgi:hypothetical protein
MKRVIAALILFSISLAANADVKSYSDEGLRANNDIEIQQVRYWRHGKHHMRHQNSNKRVTKKDSNCEHKSMKHAFSNSSRPR